MTRLQLAVLGGVLALHVGAYVAFGVIPKARKQSSVAIALAEAKKKDETEKKKPPPPKPEKEKAPAAKKTVTPPKLTPEVAPPPPTNNPSPPSAGDAPGSMSGFADLGFAMGGGGTGLAVPAGGGGGGGNGGGHPAPATTTKQVRQLAASDPDCVEDLVKPKMDHQVQPTYPPEAQQANVEGKVRLEVTIDASGHVTSVKVLNGLGFGCDEAATVAVKQWSFVPATKCGKPVPTTIKMGISFGLK